MQFMISVLEEFLPGGVREVEEGSASNDEQAAIDVFNDHLQQDGQWVFAGGLAAPDQATTLDNRGGRAVVTDGPFTEAREVAGGLWIIDVKDLETARRLAAEGSKACNRRVELRPFL